MLFGEPARLSQYGRHCKYEHFIYNSKEMRKKFCVTQEIILFSLIFLLL